MQRHSEANQHGKNYNTSNAAAAMRIIHIYLALNLSNGEKHKRKKRRMKNKHWLSKPIKMHLLESQSEKYTQSSVR